MLNPESVHTQEEAKCFVRDLINRNAVKSMKKNQRGVKLIERLLKNRSEECRDLSLFIATDKRLETLIGKRGSLCKAVRSEVEKQLEVEKAVQPGCLNECAVVQAIADASGFSKFVDFERTPYSDIPKGINLNKINEKSKTQCAARYGYYNPKIPNACILQYGNPEMNDVSFVVGEFVVTAEIKDLPALLNDTDLLYDESGHFQITDEIADSCPVFSEILENYNGSRSVMKDLGHNLSIFTGNDGDRLRNDFLEYALCEAKSELLITTAGKEREIIALDMDMLDRRYPDGVPLIDLDGSEIRTTGKNYRMHPFTPEWLDRVLAETGIIPDERGICSVPLDSRRIAGPVAGRGKNRNSWTRLKINNCFFVRREDVLVSDGNYYIFRKSDIRQSKAGISGHIRINGNKKEILSLLYGIPSSEVKEYKP